VSHVTPDLIERLQAIAWVTSAEASGTYWPIVGQIAHHFWCRKDNCM